MELLARKIAGDELDYEPRINPINEFLETKIPYYEQIAHGLRDADGRLNDQLDELFRAALKEVWDSEK